MIEGWKCPECGQVFAPFVKKCDTCKGSGVTITPIGTVIDNNPPIQMPPCQHIWGAMQTNGIFCTICGAQRRTPPTTITTCSVNTPGQHQWLGSSHGNYCADCNILQSTGQYFDALTCQRGTNNGNY